MIISCISFVLQPTGIGATAASKLSFIHTSRAVAAVLLER